MNNGHTAPTSTGSTSARTTTADGADEGGMTPTKARAPSAETLEPEARRAADAIAAAAPPLTPRQRDDLAVLLRRSRHHSNVKPTADAA